MRLAHRLLRAASWRAKARWGAQRDRMLGTFAPAASGPLAAWLQPLPFALLQQRHADILAAATAWLAHRFEVLGSGEVEVRHGVPCRGFEGRAYAAPPAPSIDAEGLWLTGRINASNLAEAQRIWRLVEPGYRPIDWHRDIRSGYRWQEHAWHRSIRFGHLPGVDVKVAWELARMQHLPALALAHALASPGHSGFEPARVYAREFRNQVLDFIATNPPRYGVNWACPMEVAIRMVNWLIARDLFVAHGAAFDDAFEHEIARSVRAHGAHLYAHQEWHPVIRGNHYLSHMAGLVFAGACLPADGDSDRWLRHGTRELLREIDYQFNPDGSNFEASTSYHRLSAEIVVHALAAALHVPAQRLQDAGDDLSSLLRSATLGQRLRDVADFLVALVRPDGGVPKLGDNDSGRLVRLLPPRDGDDDLDPAALFAAFAALEPRGAGVAEDAGVLETELIRSLADGFRFEPGAAIRATTAEPAPHRFYPDAGIYVYRRGGWFICVSCGPNGVAGHGGHAHNDKLSFELSLDGETFFTDSGSYVYTASPELRNAFRSTRAHNTLAVDGGEQNVWPPGIKGVFVLSNRARERVLRADAEGFEGSHEGFGPVHRRRFGFSSGGVVCEDWFVDTRTSHVILNLAPGTEIAEHSADASSVALRRAGVLLRLRLTGFRSIRVEEGLESERYGVRQSRPRLVCSRDADYSRIDFCRG